ncbi:MAG: GTPase Era, partial [Gemmatimonadota bacterium]
VWVVDAGFGRSVAAARELEAPDPDADLLCLNKVDRVDARRDELADGFRAAGWAAVVPTVATEGDGVDRLREEVLARLPESPPLYPGDQLAVAPVRRFVEAFVREACLRELEEEVPYSVAVSVEAFRESEEPLYIGASVFVERRSQKGIVIGEGGRMIRRIGASARKRIEAFVGRQVFLDLRVKVLPKWRKRDRALERLGLGAPGRKGG